MAYTRSFSPLVLAHVFISFLFICITKSDLPAVCIFGNCSFFFWLKRVVANKVNSWQVYYLNAVWFRSDQ